MWLIAGGLEGRMELELLEHEVGVRTVTTVRDVRVVKTVRIMPKKKLQSKEEA